MFPHLHRSTSCGQAPSKDELQRRVRKICHPDETSSHWTRAFGYAVYKILGKGEWALILRDWKDEKFIKEFYEHYKKSFQHRGLQPSTVLPEWADMNALPPDSRRWFTDKQSTRKEYYLTLEEYFSLQRDLEAQNVADPSILKYKSSLQASNLMVAPLTPFEKLFQHYLQKPHWEKASAMIRRIMKINATETKSTEVLFNGSELSECNFSKLSLVICNLLFLSDSNVENEIDLNIAWLHSDS
jgi:hypothetical protein